MHVLGSKQKNFRLFNKSDHRDFFLIILNIFFITSIEPGGHITVRNIIEFHFYLNFKKHKNNNNNNYNYKLNHFTMWAKMVRWNMRMHCTNQLVDIGRH